jgi:hypothetical protein
MYLREVSPAQSLVTVNKRLNPRIWQDGVLDVTVRERLLTVARAFEEFIGVKLNLKDVTLTGSNASFAYTDRSDLDLHLIVAGEVTDEARELFSAKKALWALEHEIYIKGMPVECYVQGESEEHHSLGVFSLITKTWLVTPKKVKPTVNEPAIAAKIEYLSGQALKAINAGDLAAIKTVKQSITKMRKAGLSRSGEWSTENMAFKALRRLGIMDQLSQVERELEDRDMSLEGQSPE